jgi:hypothetical protein
MCVEQIVAQLKLTCEGDLGRVTNILRLGVSESHGYFVCVLAHRLGYDPAMAEAPYVHSHDYQGQANPPNQPPRGWIVPTSRSFCVQTNRGQTLSFFGQH